MTGIRAILSVAATLVAATLCVAMIAVGLGASGTASAQSYPDKPIRLIVPYPPGGPMDTMARLVAQQAGLQVKQTVVVENVAGAGGTLGSKTAATANPDGYTLLWGSSGTLAIAPALYKELSYDPTTLVPVALVAKLPHVLVVPTSVPASTVQELVAYIKSKPGQVNYGASLGTPPHLIGALFKARTGVDVTYIAYKGAAPAITDMLGGETQFTFDALTVLYPLIADGRLRALAVVDTARWPLLPNVPTMVESGFPDFTMMAFCGVLAPAGTPAAIVDKLNAAINEGLKSADAQQSLTRLSALTRLGSPQDFARYLADDAPKWAELVRIAGASIR
jgi:tripartite-type tricarboxylate transporter receptor subunit TctC